MCYVYSIKSLTTDKLPPIIWKNDYSEKDKFEKETSEQMAIRKRNQLTKKRKQFWKGNIRKMTLLNRKHLKQDNSENDISKKEQSENEKLKKDDVKQDRFDHKHNPEQNKPKKIEIRKEQIWIGTIQKGPKTGKGQN